MPKPAPGQVVGNSEHTRHTLLVGDGSYPQVGCFIINIQEVEYFCTYPDTFKEAQGIALSPDVSFPLNHF